MTNELLKEMCKSEYSNKFYNFINILKILKKSYRILNINISDFEHKHIIFKHNKKAFCICILKNKSRYYYYDLNSNIKCNTLPELLGYIFA